MPATTRPLPWWIPAGAVLIAILYLPTLSTRFDFTDDGNLVYPTRPMPLGERAGIVWSKIVANYEHLGPFRPVLWVHWELEADLFGGSPFLWRLARLGWCGFAAGMLLWLFHELRLDRRAALLAGALAMWTPFRNEIWTSLTLAEGVAMPYALLGLVAAVRAARSEHWLRRLAWDLAAVGGVLLAMGCKNVFVALIPAQLALRFCPDNETLREGWRRHRWRPLLLTLPVMAFTVHFIYFKLNWHPGQYQPPGPSWAQFVRYLNGLKGGVSLDLVGIGLLLTVVALAVRGAVRDVWRNQSTAVRTGALLLVGGIVIYLPMDAVSGRYTMPAVWGADVLIAVALTAVLAMPARTWSRVAVGAFAVGLVGVAVQSVGRQQKFAARIDMLWQALEWVERQSLPPSAAVAWVSDSKASTGGRVAYTSPTPGLNIEEGVHFDWHLQVRGKAARPVRLLDEHGRVAGGGDGPPAVLVTAFDGPPAGVGDGWEKKQTFEGVYWAGRKRYRCSVWVRPPALAAARSP